VSLTPAQRTLRASIAANSMHAQGKTNTTAATAAVLARIERQVDPDGTLPPEVRVKQLRQAVRAHYQGLALKSSIARSRRRMGG
jgi:hypothetical protein